MTALMDNMEKGADFKSAVQNAYYATIRQYHGFTVRTAFYVSTHVNLFI